MALPKSKKPKRVKMTSGQSKIFDKKIFGDEPLVNPMVEPTQIEMISLLNWYNYRCERSDAHKFLVEYAEKIDKTIARKLASIDAENISTSLAWCARLSDRGALLPTETITKIKNHIADTIKKYYKPATNTDFVSSGIDKVRERGNYIIGDIEEMLDSEESFSVYDYLMKNSIPKHFMDRIINFYRPVLDELKEVLTTNDESLKEGYRNFTKTALRKLITIHETIISDCEKYSDNRKRTVVRKKKIIPAEKKVAGIQFMETFDELQLVSLSPSKILNANELWVYDARYRELYQYIALEGGFQVKNSTITNYDLAQSTKKPLGRKYKETIETFRSLGKIQLRKFMSTLSTPSYEPKGRINKNMLLLKIH